MDDGTERTSPPAEHDLPDFDALWDYQDPEATERAFRALLPRAEEAGDEAYRAALLSQIARTYGLRRRFEEADVTLDAAEIALTGAPASRAATVARARIAMERGRTRNSSGDPASACPLFVEALELAEAAGAEGFAVDAMHMLGIAAPPDEALDWNRRALARAAASEDPAARRWVGSLCNNLGWTLLERGEAEEALAVFRQGEAWHAARIAEGGGSERAHRIARWTVARALRALGRLDEALAAQRALEAELEAAGAEDGFVQEEIGECLLALGRDAEARPHFQRAVAQLSESYVPRSEPARWARLQALAEGRGEGGAP